MKIRSGFVSNSSSSSFIITDPNHAGLEVLQAHPDKVEVNLDQGKVYDIWDNGVWNILWEANYDVDEFLQQYSFEG